MSKKPLVAGEPFELIVVLGSRSATPTRFVDLVFSASERTVVGDGRGMQVLHRPWLRLPQRWTPGELGVGEYKRRFRFSVPAGSPPTFTGQHAQSTYTVDVHVDIPWWPDRHTSFTLSVAPTFALPEPTAPVLVASSPKGPQPGAVYAEVSVDTTQLAPGDALTGAVSFNNVHAARIRAVYVTFVGTERIFKPTLGAYDTRFYRALVVSGPPPEGEPLRFRVTMPAEAPPTFRASFFGFDWRVEVRADVVLGRDLVVSIPLKVLRPPPGATRKKPSGRVWPVGRDRMARIWSQVGERLELEFDPGRGSLHAERGEVKLQLGRELREGALATAARYAWPHLGLDLHVGEKRWTDVLGRTWAAPGKAGDRFTIRGREAAQIEAFFDDDLLDRLVRGASVTMDDDGAVVTFSGSPGSTASLEKLATEAVALLEALAQAVARVPPPAAMAEDAGAWRAFAERVGGHFEAGRMWVHGGALGVDRFDVGTVWQPNGTLMGTLVSFPIDPPLEQDLSPDDPTLSPATRELLQELEEAVHLHVRREEAGYLVPEPTPDPETLRPRLEAIARLLRAKRGLAGAGPFR